MGRAVQLSEAALSSFVGGRVGGVGMTGGHEAARLLKSELESRGGLELAFEPIVTSGPDSAMPHLTHTDRRIERGGLPGGGLRWAALWV